MRQTARSLLLLSLFISSLIFSACGTNPTSTATNTPTPTLPPVTLNVFAAASLTESFKEIQSGYQKKHPEVTLTYQFAGSQALVQQLTNGANADVFASADQTNMQKAKDANLVTTSQIFAKNKLVVIVPASNPGHINSLKDLSTPGLKIVVAAPSVPVGKYGLQVLDNLGKAPDYGSAFEAGVKANFVSQEDNVKAVVQKVQLGEADAGIVYQTDVTPAVASKVKVLEIPNTLNVVAEYPIAVLKNSTHIPQSQAFVQYLLAPEGQVILKKYNFIAANAV